MSASATVENERMNERMKNVKHVILVLSGKGGVGKSTITVQIASSLVAAGQKVGLLDLDLSGPSIPKMLGLEDKVVHQASDGWAPVYADDDQKLAVMSIGFLVASPDDPIIWRGPKKHGFIKKVLEDTYWGELDYLVIDTPPGTSDEHIAVVENLRAYNPDGVVLVTTPQGVALVDVRREATFCRKAKLPIIGIVENMSGFVCPHCAECTNLFSSGGGEKLATECKVPFLGRVPIDPALGASLERGERYLENYPKSQVAIAVANIVKPLLELSK